MQTIGSKILLAFLLLFALGAKAQTTVPVINGGTGCTTAPCAAAAIVNGNPIRPSLVGGTYSSYGFGVKCDGTTDDSTALNSIGTFAASLSAGATVTVFFPSNATCPYSTEISTWLKPNLHLEMNGSRLHFTGTGPAIYLHSTATETDNFWLRDLVLQGNASATYGILEDSLMARGRLDITNLQDFTTACADLEDAQLMDQMSVSCSSIKATAMGIPQTTTPTSGVLLGLSGSTTFANNRYTNFTVEGTGSGVGLRCQECTNGNIFAGTTESTGGTGFQFDSSSAGNTVIGFDSESNMSFDFVDEGEDDTFENCISTGNFVANTTSIRTKVKGGWFNSLYAVAGSNNPHFESLQYNIENTGGITIGSTLFPSFEKVFNAQTGGLYVQPDASTQVSNVEVSTQSISSSARNWEWMPDFFSNGDLSLYRSASNTSAPSAGTQVAYFDSSNNFSLLSGSYEVAGSPFATSNLADWTNSGVANGSVPVWNSGTSKWTPGVQNTTPIRAGTWSISSATSVPVVFSTAMGVTPTSCSVSPTASSATTGQPYPTSLATTGFTVNVPNSGTIAGTYQCEINNAN